MNNIIEDASIYAVNSTGVVQLGVSNVKNLFQIDELRISNTYRYNENSFEIPHRPFDTDPYTQILYHFDESTHDAKMVTDSSGNGHNASVNGIVFFENSFLPICQSKPACLSAKPRACKIVEPAEGWCEEPIVDCQPRPTCLDAKPKACKIVEPDEGWCE